MESESGDPAAHFVDKWYQREHEMRFAEVFCPGEVKTRFRAWGALLHELREAMFELSDPRVASAKTAWWAEEVIAIEQGRQRHPLTAALAGLEAPWQTLGRAMIECDAGDNRAADTAQAVDLLLPLAAAVLAVESAIFDASSSTDSQRSLVVHWLLQRLPRGLASPDQARIPMHLLARHGLTAANLPGGRAEALLQDWGRELASAMPSSVPGAALLRRSRHRFDLASAERLAAGRGFAQPPPPITLWRSWRAARDV